MAACALAAAVLATSGPYAATASSHREAPRSSRNPQEDNTDTYAFVSPDRPDTVTIIGNWLPFSEPNGGPNFYAFATRTAYDFNIDNDGDAKADIIYRWTFFDNYRSKNTFLYNTGVVTSLDDPDLNFFQTYKLERITPGGSNVLVRTGRVAPSRVGQTSMPNYEALSNSAITSVPGGGKTIAGQFDDSFFLDLRVFDLLYGAPNFNEIKQDTLRGYNVNSIALQVPKKDLALKGDPKRNPVIGVWSTTSRPRVQVVEKDGDETTKGDLQQVSRLGSPLVNELVVPVGKKDEFNATKPADDAKFAQFVTNPEVPRLIEALYKIPAPATPRDDLVQVFLKGVFSQSMNKDADPNKFRLSEMLRLNMSIKPTDKPNRLGVVGGDQAGYPNGRRLDDDTVDITLQAAEGILRPNPPDAVKMLGDGVDANEVPFRNKFPYLAVANGKAVNQS